MIPRYDIQTDPGRAGFAARLDRLRATTGLGGDARATVQAIIADVRQRGDDAVVHYMQKWTDPQFSLDRITVTPTEIQAARKSVAPDLLRVIQGSIDNVRRYQEHIRPPDPPLVKLAGAELGLRFTPVDSVGLCVPGGAAVLFSTLIMLAVPALAAGVPVDRLCVINPPPTRKGDAPAGDISPIVLATCDLLGIRKIYRIGGAQAVAALALGTSRVGRVDMIAGPGNVFVQLAKQEFAGAVGTDGFYGPSEIVTIADDSADPRKVAADLIAQAEHDPGKCFLISWCAPALDRITAEITRQLTQRDRRAAIEKSLQQDSCALLVPDVAAALDLTNTIAPEHLNLATAAPDQLLPGVRHAGEVFLGDTTPVAAGDYWAGPSHCLPTGTTARFASGISVYTFLKRMGTVRYPGPMPADAINAIAAMAHAEGLDGHAASVEVRRKD